MRIKVRAWHKLLEEFVQPHRFLVIDADGCLHNDDVEIMQFTGLTDKNGVEIYENSEIDGEFIVSTKGCDYVLISISCGDIVKLQDYYSGASGNVKVTREYARVQENS